MEKKPQRRSTKLLTVYQEVFIKNWIIDGKYYLAYVEKLSKESFPCHKQVFWTALKSFCILPENETSFTKGKISNRPPRKSYP